MADQDQLAAFSYHWKAAGLSSTTLRYYLSWLARLDVDDDTTDLELAAALADMTPSQRHYARSRCRPRARAWTNRTLRTPERRHGARVVAHAAR